MDTFVAQRAPDLIIEQAGFDLPLSLAVLAGVAVLYTLYLTLRPLIEEGEISGDDWAQMEDETLALLRRRDRVIAELKELEFEAAMNKLDDQDLSRLRSQYEREALALIQTLDEQSAVYQNDIQAHVDATREAARSRRRAAEAARQPEDQTAEHSAQEDQAVTNEVDASSTQDDTEASAEHSPAPDESTPEVPNDPSSTSTNDGAENDEHA